jgi:DNA-directed RNA polymerase specialized sigma24 family protein
MNDPQNVSTAGLAALFDAHGNRLFRYCWFMLRNRDIAQIALRDTLVVAQAHLGRLTDQDQVGSWLYALARVECRRRRAASPADADEPPARPSQPDADSRLMAWNAVTSMSADEAEVLELACRHDVDLRLVLGVPGPAAGELLDRARRTLESALGAEILVRRVSHACPDRAEVLRGWGGTVTPELRDRVLRHAQSCPVCGPNLPRNVAAARVFALLPAPALPADARQRILDFSADPQMSAYRQFAVARAAELSDSGFPVGPVPVVLQPAGKPGAGKHGGVQPRVLAAVGAAAAAAAIAAALVLAAPGPGTRNPGQAPPATAAGPFAPHRTGAGAGAEGAIPVARPTAVMTPLLRATSPGEQLFAKLTKPLTKPLAATVAPDPPLPPPRLPQKPVPAAGSTGPAQAQGGSLTVSPGSLALGSAAQGQVQITADGATESWSANSPSDEITLSADGGTLAAGQSTTLQVSIDRVNSAGGSAVIYVEQGSTSVQTVRVTWAGTWSRSAPQPTPTSSPTWSPSPVPSPSPSPSNSSGSSPPVWSGSPPPHSGPPHPSPPHPSPPHPSPPCSGPPPGSGPPPPHSGPPGRHHP